MADNLGQTDESLVAVALACNANVSILLFGKAFKLLAFLKKTCFECKKHM